MPPIAFGDDAGVLQQFGDWFARTVGHGTSDGSDHFLLALDSHPGEHRGEQVGDWDRLLGFVFFSESLSEFPDSVSYSLG